MFPRIAAVWWLAAILPSPVSAVLVNGNIETDIRPAIWMNFSGAAGSTAVGIWDSGDSRQTLSRDTAALLTLTPTSPINPFNAGLPFQNRGTPAAQNITAGGWLGAFLDAPEQTLNGVAAWPDPNIRIGTADQAHVFNNANLARPVQLTVNGQIPFYKDFNDRFSENHSGAPYTAAANPANDLVGQVDPINGSPLPFAYDNTRGGNGRGLGPAFNPLDSRTSNVSFFAANNARVPMLANNQNPGFVHFVTMLPIEFGSSTLIPSATATTPSGAAVAVNAGMGVGVTHRLTLSVPAGQAGNYNRLIPQHAAGLDPFYSASNAAGNAWLDTSQLLEVANAGILNGGNVNGNGFALANGTLQVDVRNATTGGLIATQNVVLPSQAPRPFVTIGGVNYLADTGAPTTDVPPAVFAAGTATGNPNVRLVNLTMPLVGGGNLTVNNVPATNAGAGGTPVLGTDVTNRFGQFWNFTPQNAAGGNNNGTLALYGPTDPRVIALRDNGILFSVDGSTSGLAATAVNQEKLFGAIPQLEPNSATNHIPATDQPDEAKGTIFRTHLTGSNATYIDELAMELHTRRRNVVMDAQSLGADGINVKADVFFSVTRDAVGQAGSAVQVQAGRNQVAADIFEAPAHQIGVSRSGRKNRLFINQEVMGLGPNFGPLVSATIGAGNPHDDLNSFDLDTGNGMSANALSNLDSPIIRPNDDGNVNRPRVGDDIFQSNFDVYFSLADSGIGDGARIYRSDVSDLFADGHDMGLADMDIGSAGIDDLDALSLWRPGVGAGVREGDPLLPGTNLSSTLMQNFNFGGGFFVFDSNDDRDFEGIDMFHGQPPTDLALFSLAPGSQTLNFFGLSPGDLFITDFDGTFSLFATAESLGLRFNDNLDGLDSLAVPEPSALLLLMAGALGLGVRRRKPRLKTPRCRECAGTG